MRGLTTFLPAVALAATLLLTPTSAFAVDCTTTPTDPSCTTSSNNNSSSTFLLSGLTSWFQSAFGSDEAVISKAKLSERGIFEGGTEAIVGRRCSTSDSTGKTIKSCVADAGALGLFGRYTMAMIDNPPNIHTTTYLAKLNPIGSANAATGRDLFNPIFDFWQAIRNVAYGLFVLVLVAIGFMIMFRSKIDPRTTVSVTAALPNIVISLVLITFSLTLAGVLIDLGSVITQLVGNILVQQVHMDPAKIIDASPGDVFSTFALRFTPPSLNIGDAFIVGGLAAALFNLVISVVALFITFNIFFMLLFRYAALLIKPIFAPLTFLFGALPGNSGLIGSWFKGYLVDVLVFPLVLFILNLAKFIMDSGTKIAFPAALGGGGDAGNIAALVGLGVLLMATKIPAILEEALDVKPSSHVGKAGVDVQKAAKAAPLVGKFLG